ncbi:GNAT family N-acetyltransferase [Phytomonospora sp. NPDC050363]|uniref:GNAT family N-acetyltransferase n=1 Tax=Phytomonospora sp. NPDC050363 TaxID=3155642 RepID=UPI0033E0514C
MITARRATAIDVDELVRLRGVMQAALHGEESAPGPWQAEAAAVLQRQLDAGDATLAAFVVERPDEPGRLAACAVGVIDQRLGSPANPAGRTGYVFSVSTDEGYRRRGYARACMEGVLGWYREQGIRKVDLRASVDAEPLYRSLGFARTPDPSMRLTM